MSFAILTPIATLLTVALFRTVSDFPRYACTYWFSEITDMIAERDKVVLRWTFRGTQQGELMGIPPTGKQVTMAGISIYHFANGMLAEIWENYDKLGFLQQLGVIPASG